VAVKLAWQPPNSTSASGTRLIRQCAKPLELVGAEHSVRRPRVNQALCFLVFFSGFCFFLFASCAQSPALELDEADGRGSRDDAGRRGHPPSAQQKGPAEGGPFALHLAETHAQKNVVAGTVEVDPL
jgi:hypothetical protein